MSRLKDKIEKARQAVSDAEGVLEDLEAKQRQYKQKSSRKNHQRKFASDPTYRLMVDIEKTMFSGYVSSLKPGQVLETFLGIDAQISPKRLPR